MAFAVKRMYGPTQPTTTAETLYTPTTGVLPAVIKEVILANNTTSAGLIKLGIGGVNSSQLFVPDTYVVAVSTSAAVDNMVVLALSVVLASTSDNIQALNGGTGLITLTVNGEETS